MTSQQRPELQGKEIPERTGGSGTGNAPAQLEKPPCSELMEAWGTPCAAGGNIPACFCSPSFRDLQGSAARLRCGRSGVMETGLGLEKADFCINIAGNLCGEEGMGTSSLFSKMFNSERLH